MGYNFNFRGFVNENMSKTKPKLGAKYPDDNSGVNKET